MATFDQFISSIINDGNDGKAFEVFCKHFLETAPEYRNQFEKVWLWDNFPNKWSQDKGVDLIAKYKGRDKYCAIQAKCYAAHNTVPYSEVTNFLADSNRVEIEDRILMMSTNKLSEKTSKEVIAGQEKQVIIRDRQYFESVNYDYPSHISELSKAKEKPKVKPREHQRAAIDDVEKGLKDNDRGQLIMACGTGKTFTTLWIKERLKANTVLVLLPSLSLLSQTMREWVWGANDKFEALAVCSDPTVGKSKNPEEDISNAEVGKVTWHVDEIRSFLKSDSPKVIFCTYQSSELIQEAQEDDSIPQFDLVVCDEAHRCAGKANAGFATVLHEDKIRAEKRIFTTATPRYYGKSVQSAVEGRGVEIIGMDDEAKFGPVVHKLTFGQAIEMDMLTDYQVVVVGVDEPMVREWIAEGEIVSYGDGNHTDARTLAAKIAVLKAIKDYDLKRVISFHNSISRAKELALDVYDVAQIIDLEHRPTGKIWSQHVDGKMSAGKRRDLINGLKDLDGYDIGLLTNARCLSEGVDVPTLDGVAFVDPRGSQVDIIQAVGRAIRKSDNKNKGTIVLPVFLEAGDDPDTVIDASNFKPVWDVLKALRAHDEVLADKLDQYRTDMGLGVERNSGRIEKIIFDLPTQVTEAFALATTTMLIEKSTISWFYWYGKLKKYYELHGDCNVKKHSENGLGNWVSKQRKAKTDLTITQIKKLDDLGFDWDPLANLWQAKYTILRDFYEEFGHSDVPTTSEIYPWCGTQRENKEKLANTRIKLLEKLDFTWNLIDKRWNTAFDLLKLFVIREGHSLVKISHIEGDYPLGVWVGKQRLAKKTMPRWKIDKLNSVDFIWSKYDATWQLGFQEYKKYWLKTNRLQIPAGLNVNGVDIAKWASRQRNRRHQLTEQQIMLLDEIGFKWDIQNELWTRAIEALIAFKAREGHVLVPTGHIENDIRLGTWVRTQRSQKKSLSDIRKRQLEDIGFVWKVDFFELNWSEGLRCIKEYIKEHGTSFLPHFYKHESGFNLGGWVRSVRSKENYLEASKKAEIENIEGWYWSKAHERWCIGYNKLMLFVAKNGHACPTAKYVTQDGFKLGAWVHNKKARKNSLARNKINALEKLAGWKWIDK